MSRSELVWAATDTQDAVKVLPGPNAEGVRWNLARIFENLESARAALTLAESRAANFSERHRGRTQTLMVLRFLWR